MSKCPVCGKETDLFTCECGTQIRCTICEEPIPSGDEVFEGGVCDECDLERRPEFDD